MPIYKVWTTILHSLNLCPAAGLIAEKPSYNVSRAASEKQFAESNAFGGFNQALGDAAGKVADYAQRYPELASALSATTTALKSLAAAAGVAGLAGLITGGGSKALAGAAAATGGAKVFSGLRAGAAMLMGAGSMGEIGMMGGGAMAAAGGAALGVAGTTFGVGYGLNRAIQGTKVGNWLDDAIGRPLAKKVDALLGNTDINGAVTRPDKTAQTTDMLAGKIDNLGRAVEEMKHKEIPLSVTVDVKGGNIVAEVNKTNSREAKRF